MSINIFKTRCYKISLSSENVIEKIKTKTLYGSRIANDECIFKGKIWKNAFKIQQYSNSKVKVGIGKNVDVFPVFYGELQPEGLHTNLYVKMRPNPFGYFICVFPLIALLLALISFILTINNILIDNSNIENMIIFAPLLTIIGYLVLYFYYFIKLHDMEYKLKDIFKKNLINSDL